MRDLLQWGIQWLAIFGFSRRRTNRRRDMGANMRHFCARGMLSSAFILAVISIAVLGANAQTQKKESVWDTIKKAARQGQQQGQPRSQQPQKPGQHAPTPAQPGNAQFNDYGPFKAPDGTKIEEKILAPLQEGASFEVSPHGVHVATTETDGSRAVGHYEGVEGPEFDEIYTLQGSITGSRVAFSPDGGHYAYCARSCN